MAAEWQRARELKPGIYFIGNTNRDLDEPEYVNKLNGDFWKPKWGKAGRSNKMMDGIK